MQRTLLLVGMAILLLAIPQVFYVGELAECRARYQTAKIVPSSADKEETVGFDICTAVDYGMFDWMRYAMLLSLVMLIVSAYSYRKDWKFARERRRVDG